MSEAGAGEAGAPELRLADIDNASLIRLAFFTGVCFWGLVGIAFGVFALFGATGVRRNGLPVTGLEGLQVSLVLAFFFTLIHTLAVAFGGAMARSFPVTGRSLIKTRRRSPALDATGGTADEHLD